MYLWDDATWHLQSTYRAAEHQEVEIYSRRAPVVDIFVQESFFSGSIVVVEENHVLRWWHTYEWDGLVWKYRTSSEVLLNRIAVLCAEGVVGSDNYKVNGSLYLSHEGGKENRVQKGEVDVPERKWVDVVDLTGED